MISFQVYSKKGREIYLWIFSLAKMSILAVDQNECTH